jgi:hypothetical protein
MMWPILAEKAWLSTIIQIATKGVVENGWAGPEDLRLYRRFTGTIILTFTSSPMAIA